MGRIIFYSRAILLVDDDEYVLFGYKRSLAGNGYRVQAAISLNEATKLVACSDFDAVRQPSCTTTCSEEKRADRIRSAWKK